MSAALEARGVRGHVYLVGGGALITGYGRDRTTNDAREERGEPVPDLALAENRTLRAKGAGSLGYEAMAEEQADGSETLRVTVRDPEAPADPSRPGEDHGARERGLLRTTGDGVVRSLEEANEVVNRYEQTAAVQDWSGMGGRKPVRTGGNSAPRFLAGSLQPFVYQRFETVFV